MIVDFFNDVTITIKCDKCGKEKNLVFPKINWSVQEILDADDLIFKHFNDLKREDWLMNEDGKHCCIDCIRKIDKERKNAEALKNGDHRLDFADGSPLFP